MQRGAVSEAIHTIVGIVCLLLSSGVAPACDLTGYDQTPPPAITDFVDAHGNCFRWSSDLDVDRQGGKQIWNYIQNATDQDHGLCKDALATGRPLAVEWDLGGIEQTTLRPLPAGKIACQRVPVGESGAKETYAPLTYDLQAWKQDAYAYVDQGRIGLGEQVKDFLKQYVIRFMTSYTTGGTASKDLDVEVRTEPTREGFHAEISLKPPGTILGISNWAESLGGDRLEALKQALNREHATVDQSQLGRFMNQEGLRALFGNAGPDLRQHDEYLFFRMGDEPVRFDVATERHRLGDATLIMLDEDHVPIARTQGMLLVP